MYRQNQRQGIRNHKVLGTILRLLLGISAASLYAYEVLFFLRNLERTVFEDKPRIATERQNLPSSTVDDEPQAATKRTKKLGDGCYHVFLDVGANIGMNGRFLYEPEKYPVAKVHRAFDRHFGKPAARDNRFVCIFAFEPNPAHRERLVRLQNAYNRLGWRYHYLPFAAGDRNETLTFFKQDNDLRNEISFSVVRGGPKAENVPVKVPTVRLSSWLREHIEGRRIPDPKETPTASRAEAPDDDADDANDPTSAWNDDGASAGPPKVVMKFDVEGTEYILFPDLLFTGTLCSVVDFVFGEPHHWKGANVFPDQKTGKGGLKLNSREEALAFFSNLRRAFASLRNSDCKTEPISIMDSEEYLMDGIPLPGES